MGSVWGDAEYEQKITELNESVKRLRQQNEALLALAQRVAEPGADEHRIEGTLAIVLEARALVRLIGKVR